MHILFAYIRIGAYHHENQILKAARENWQTFTIQLVKHTLLVISSFEYNPIRAFVDIQGQVVRIATLTDAPELISWHVAG